MFNLFRRLRKGNGKADGAVPDKEVKEDTTGVHAMKTLNHSISGMRKLESDLDQVVTLADLVHQHRRKTIPAK